MLSRAVALVGLFAVFAVGGGVLAGLGSADEDLVVVDAAGILDEIRDGKAVERRHVRIVGSIDLRELEGPVRSSIEIVDCEIQDLIRMEGVAFEAPVSFEETAFENMVLFSGVRFNDSADFSFAAFEDTVFFDSAVFGEDAEFCGTRFGRDAYFSGAVFFETCDFNFTRFAEEYVLFDGVRFLGDAHFEDAEFGRWTNFYGSTFSGAADFLLATFPGRSFITNVTFERDANFAGVEFMSFAEFEDSRFEGDFFLYGSTISYMKLNGTTFGESSTVHLNNTEIEGFVIPWRTMEDHLVFRDEVYMGLVENYKRLGWFQDADDCYYHYRKLAQERKDFGWSKAIDYLAWLSCGYGVRPDYTLAWSLSIVLVFGAVFYVGRGLLQYERPDAKLAEGEKRSEDRKADLQARIKADPPSPEGEFQEFGSVPSIPERPTLGEAMYFSSLVFIAQAPADYLALGRYKYLVIVEGVFGWLMLALFLVALGNLMIR
jgi:uncharacterized protein YjbI with pentapeptide repeats